MQYFDEAATREALPFPTLIESLRALLQVGCTVPERHVHQIEGSTNGTTLIMPAWNNRYLGVKIVNIFPRNAAMSLPALHSTYQLFSSQTGEPLCQMDGDVITSRRTAATSALAASYLIPSGSKRLMVVGAGRVASLLPEAYGALFDLTEVAVWNRTRVGASALVSRLRDKGIPATETADLARSAGDADIVSCATLATEPIMHGAWLRAGSHLDLIGSFTPQMREADDDAMRDANIYVGSKEAKRKSGDLLSALASTAIVESDIVGTLAELCTGTAQPLRNGKRTVFKSVGSALEDLAAAVQVYEAGGHSTK